ncbi:tumor necrosis factor receptor superfamily member 3-like [Saccostrea echinata]|uniref:tumor necrosis factor receptor superfamily member 3-like n=1 Tax=Saccostrea echinata TaxID=191078 RepID=UPI002A836899|nr:tumor necrosis factor receptor superfamily member 3-like [Saccostrea echinata]XP_061188577.1 tumor necrosis factor receptor superfamily member 3-like [Saccostrea echinata]
MWSIPAYMMMTTDQRFYQGTIMVWYFYAATVVLPLIQAVEDTCRTNYTYRVENTNLVCGCCAPGFYKEADCQESDKSAECKACPSGQFSLFSNQATSCQPCSTSCPRRNSEIVSNCTTLSDIGCECREGFYMKYRSPTEGLCVLHSKCQPGFYVQKLGTSTEDTDCMPCPEGMFQDRENLDPQCKNCSRCSDPSKETQGCSRQSDTQCNDKPTSQFENEKETTPPEVVGGAIAGVLVVVVLVALVVLICYRKGQRPPCLKVARTERCEEGEMQDINTSNGHTSADPEEHMGISRLPENGQHLYSLIKPNTVDSPKRDKKPVSRRVLVERSWGDLCLLLQKELPIGDWKFVIRELFATVGKSADRVLEEHEANHPRNVREQIYCCLQSFSQQTDLCSFDLQKLSNILCNHEHIELAEKIQDDNRFNPLFPNRLPDNSCAEFGDVARTQ